MTHATLTQINVYPAKLPGGFSVNAADVEPRGLRHDRRWMLVDKKDRFLTLAAPGMEPLEVPFKPVAPAQRQSVQVWGSVCKAAPVGEQADGWFGEFLGVPCRLVFIPDETRRPVNPNDAAGAGTVSFADGSPLLLLGEESLPDLNARLESPVPKKGEAAGPEPLQTLAVYRTQDQKVLFGRLLIPDDAGTVHLGDAIEVL